MTKINDNDFMILYNLLKEIKDEIFIKPEDIDKKRHDLIENFKDTPEFLIKCLNETVKPYKSIKDIKILLKSKGFTITVKDSMIKFIIENIEF